MKECQNIEWKETWSDEYLKWICGFANAQGGKLYIGVDASERYADLAARGAFAELTSENVFEGKGKGILASS